MSNSVSKHGELMFVIALLRFQAILKWVTWGSVADIPDAPGKPEIIDYDNKSVDLKWRAPKSDNGAKIEKYIVEKRNKKTGDWEKVGEVSGVDRLESECKSRLTRRLFGTARCRIRA